MKAYMPPCTADRMDAKALFFRACLLNLPVLLRKSLILIALLCSIMAFSQTHEYLFTSGLVELNGGPALAERLTCGAASGSSSTQSVAINGVCYNFPAYCFARGAGFRYTNTGTIGGTYTVNLYCKLNTQNYNRVLDFSGGTVDRGLYILNGCLILYGVGNIGVCPFFNSTTYYLITVMRDATTNMVTVYVDGVLLGSILDASGYCAPLTPTSPVDFFTDNNCESPFGCIRYASVSPTIATATDIAQLYVSLPVLTGEIIGSGPTVSINPSAFTLNCTTPTTTLTTVGTGTYAWNGGATSSTRSVNAAGTYTVTLTDANGCTSSASSVVTSNTTPPTASISPSSSSLTCSTTSVTLTANGGTGYNWGGGVTTNTKTVSSPGNYSVTVTGANGCTATASATVNQNIALPTATITPASATLTCAATTATLTAGGGSSYNWGGGIITAANTVSSANTYTVTVTGANGCTATRSAVVSENTTLPVASITPAGGTITCATPTITLTAAGGGTYDWGGGITTAAKTVNAGGTYTITVTAANGCTATASVTINQTTTPPVAGISPANAALTCSSAAVTLTASGGVSYNWGGGIITATNTVNAANTYTVTVTDANGCSATATSTVTQNINAPVVSISPAGGVLNCTNPSLMLTASGGATYDWGSGITTADNTVSTPNTYTVTATAANGCTATASATITRDITPPVAAVTPANAAITCATNIVTLTANGGGTYDWGGGLTSATNTVSAANTYTVTVTAANGCTASASSVVTQSVTPPAVSISPATATLTCTTLSTTLTANSAAGYDWGGGITTAANTVNTAGTYTVTVTDVNGCTATASAIVSQDITPPAAAVNPLSGTITCVTTFITLTATGGASYNWGGGVTTAAYNVNTGNTYTVTATGSNGCTATAAATIVADNTPPVVTISTTANTLDCISISSTLTASGGTTYNWGGGITTTTNTINSPGTYSVTATASNGCTASASSVITQNITPPVAAINPASAILTCASPAVLLTASGGQSYDWGGGINTATNSVTAPNNYTVTVTGANGCTATASSAITQNAATPPAAVSPASAAIDCNTASATLTASGGNTYDWGGGVTTAAITVTAANTYTVTVTDANGCTGTAAATVSQDFTPPSATITLSNATLNCTTLSTTLTAGGGVQYDWGAGITTATQTVSTANTYVVTVTGNNGCTASASVVVIQDITPPVAVVSPANATLTCSTNSITLTASGGSLYDWGGGVTTTNNTVTAANTYNVTVTGSNGCTATASSVVNQNITPPVAGILPASGLLTCTNQTVVLTAGGGATYSWSGGVTTPAITVSGAGTYTVTVTGANGCTATAAATVSQDITPPNVSIAPGNTLDCAVTSTTLTASSTTANASFNWGNNVTTPGHTVTSGGNYTVTATDPANSCTATASATVTQDITPPNISTSVSGILSCVNTSVATTASSTTASVSYDWGGGNTTNTNTVAAAGNYTVTITDRLNSCTATATQIVTANTSAPPVNISLPGPLTCANTSVTLVATSTVAGVQYNWGNGLTAASNTVSTPASYSVTATDPVNGCSATVAATVNQNISAPVVNIGAPGVITCHSPSVTLTAASSATNTLFNWGAGNVNANLVVSAAGSYSVTVTDAANGCTATATAAVTEIPLMTLTSTHTNASCFGFTDGAIDLNVTGGQTPLTYQWTNTATTEDLGNLAAGNYTVIVTDGISCTASLAVQITQPASMTLTQTHTDVVCNGAQNGTINLTVTDGTPAYSFQWNDNNTSQNRTALAAGNYIVTVTDNNLCSISVAVPITEPAALVIQSTLTQPTCATNGNDGAISVVASGGIAPYSYLWSNGVSGANNPFLGEGNFDITVTDAHSCVANETYQLQYIYNFVVDASPFTTIKLGESTELAYTLTGNTGNFTASWTPDYALSCTDCALVTASPVYSTLYNITITNDLGCTAFDTVTVSVTPAYETFVPNAFSPNGDGVNDLFEIYGNLNGVEYLEVQIFNRTGEKVFESNNHNFKWDGTYQGALLAPQVFVWKMKLTWLNGHIDEQRKGTLTLLK